MIEINDTKVLFLAIWLHETYEAQAREVGWKTQESCRVKFDELPEANKKVMLKIARDIAYNLEANKQEGRVEGAVKELENILNWLELCSKGKNRVRTLPLIKIGLCKDVIEKRLKELDGGLRK